MNACRRCGAAVANEVEALCPRCFREEQATLPPVAPTPAAERRSQVPGYEILGELGRGGMGVVYKARQVSLGRIVALKMILSGGHAGETEMARFRAEAESIARLQHPNIVQVFEIGEHEGVPFMALEYCAGGSLEARLQGQPQQPRQAATLIRTLAEAMHAAHQANVVHRDLKPANVLLAACGLVGTGMDIAKPQAADMPKITDFGLAKRLDEQGQTVSGAIMGTPSYMAPEQADGRKDVGPAADIYALGAILYECLTGRPPFRAANMIETLAQVVSEEPVPPRLLQPKVPRDLETIALKCLEKSPARRYATAQDLADDLERFLADESIQARRPGVVERGMRWMRKLGLKVAWTAGLMLALVMALFFSMIGIGLYVQSLMGELELTTDGPPLTAEVLDAHDRVTQRFRVPTADPVRLDPGSHRLRLSAPGWPSEDVNVLITTRGKHRFEVDARRRELWPAVEGLVVTLGNVPPAVWPLAMPYRTDVVVNRAGKISRIDGRTGAETDLGKADDYKPATIPGGFRFGVRGKGTGDVVVFRPDGTVSSLGDGPAVLRAPAAGANPLAVLGYLPAAEEGRLDLLLYGSPGRGGMLERLGGDGRRVWQQPVKFSVRPQETVTVLGRVAGEPVLIVADSSTAAWMNPATGAPIGMAECFLGASHPPIVADVDGDGDTDVIWGPSVEQAASGRGVVVQSLRQGKPVWRRTGFLVLLGVMPVQGGGLDVLIETGSEHSSLGGWVGVERLSGRDGSPVWTRPAKVLRNLASRTDWAKVRAVAGPDLDGDGVADVFVVAGTDSGVYSREVGLHARALSGSDGRTLWHRTFDALPGQRIWEHSYQAGPLLFWPGGPGGVPRLVVQNMSSGSQTRHHIDILDGGNGRVLHRIADAAEPFIADLDGDGLPELVYQAQKGTEASQEYESGRGGLVFAGEATKARLRVIRGTAPERWRWLGRWEPIHDLDGDGINEILRRERDGTLAVADGASGKLIWPGDDLFDKTPRRGEPRSAAGGSILSLCRERGKSREATLLVVDRLRKAASRRQEGQLLPPLRAVSSSNGGTRWQAAGVPIEGRVANSYEGGQLVSLSPPLWLASEEKILVRARADIHPPTGGMSRQQTYLLLFSAGDGSLVWSQHLGSHRDPSRPDLNLPVCAAVAGSKEQRMLLVIERLHNAGWRYVLQGRDLKTGVVRWSANLDGVQAHTVSAELGIMPPPTVGVLNGKDDAVLVRDGAVVRAYDALTGKPLWGFADAVKAELFPLTCYPPRIVRPPGRPPLVCFSSLLSTQVVTLDDAGQLQKRYSLPLDVAQRVVPHNPTGDDRDALVVCLTGASVLRFDGPAAKPLWTWKPPPNQTMVKLLDVAEADAGRTVILRTDMGNTLFGLRGSDSKVLWQLSTAERLAGPATVGMLSASERPSVVLSWLGRESVARMALPVENGKYQLPPLTPRTYPPVTDDPQTLRPLPWASGELPLLMSQGRTWLWLTLWMLLAVVVFVIPYRFFCLAVIRRSVRWLLAWAGWLAALAGLIYLLYSEVNFRLGVNGPPLGFDTYLITFLLALMGLSLLLPLWTLAVKLLRGEWRGIGWLVLVWLLCVAALAVGMMAYGARSLEEDQRYTWAGWYMVALPALMLTGALLFLAGVCGVLWRGVRGKKKRRAAAVTVQA